MSRTSLLSSHALRATAVLALALSLGACSRQQNASESLTGPGREGAGTRVVVGCPTLLPNTAATSSVFATEMAMVPRFNTKNIRIEATGDIPALATLAAMAPCAAADLPSINFTGGHANVFLSGTTTSLTGPLTFGPLLFPGSLIEPGVVVANDANKNVLEIIWPTLAGTGTGGPIVRIQLAKWNTALVNTASKIDIVWDMTVTQDATTHFISGTTVGIPMSGQAIFPNAAAPLPCPLTLGAGGAVVSQLASVPRFTAKSLRFEIIGDVAAGTIGLSGPCAASATPAIVYTGGTGNVTIGGVSVTNTGRALTFGALLFPGIALEPGVVVANDASKNVLEIIWPSLAGTGTGAPVLRLQLAAWSGRVVTGAKADVAMQFNAIGPDGLPAVFTANAAGLTIPVRR
ncbi:MAG: hypothetical protein K8R56_10480 [Candidatus Eisenbacteria bacterium]|nr:hypothetical protein [Candidatus Eisenbacteria bacterium]